MFAVGMRYARMAAALVLLVMWTQVAAAAQYEKVTGVETPDDVTGADCTMCHGTIASEFKFQHPPAAKNDCIQCHQTKGNGSHGALIANDRSLCLKCHKDKEAHYPVLTCWTASCHNQMHGSNVDKYFNPNREEAYPGFTQATCGAKYVGTDRCLSCHGDMCEAWTQSLHSQTDIDYTKNPTLRGCESCHGPGGNHDGRRAGIGDFRQATSSETNKICLVCHRDEIYNADYEHNRHSTTGMSCTTCHGLHSQENKHNLKAAANSLCLGCHKSQRIEFAKFSHHPVDTDEPRSGMLCVDCHDPHGGGGRMMLAADRDELCFKCHVDKQGPFVYTHAGYESGMGQGCYTCHEVHGSNAPNLLKMSGRGLCLQCHNDRVTHFPNQTCWTTGCHSDHHGSNKNYFFFNK